MRAVDDLLKRAKQLPPRERRRLVSALTALDTPKRSPKQRRQDKKAGTGLEIWRALAGTGHSTSSDVSADKYKHLAEVYADSAPSK